MPKPGAECGARMGQNEQVLSHLLATPTVPGWPVRLATSLGFAGFLALMAQISFPLPWTPVPFSMMPFALLVAGGYQKPGLAALSVLIYLAAGALGAPVFAQGASGLQHFVGATAGYLFGFVLVAALVSRYMQHRRPHLPHRLLVALVALVAVSLVAAVAVIAWMNRTGTGLEADFGVGASTLWALAFITLTSLGLTYVLLGNKRGEGAAAANLWLVMLGTLLLLHACGVTVLWALTPYTLIQSIALGSTVFLPFDIVKAGLAVALTLPFLPSPPPTASLPSPSSSEPETLHA